MDRTMTIIAVVAVAAILAVAWLHISTSSRMATLRADEEAAVRDSIRYAQLRSQGDSLRDQVAIISQKLEVIQQIDGDRYVWPHIMDAVSRALPEFVWLTNVTESSAAEGNPRIRLQGRAGTYPALGRYMRELENSPFLMNARLISSERTQADERTVYGFVLDVTYQDPPPDVIRTVPLFPGPESED